MPGLKERAKTLLELADGAAFLFAERPLTLDEKAAGLVERIQPRDVLARRDDGSRRVPGEWSAAATEAAIRDFAARNALKLGACGAAAARRADRPKHVARCF